MRIWGHFFDIPLLHMYKILMTICIFFVIFNEKLETLHEPLIFNFVSLVFHILQMIDIVQYRLAIANAGARQEAALRRKKVPGRNRKEQVWCLLLAMLLVIGGIELNPGPTDKGMKMEERLEVYIYAC